MASSTRRSAIAGAFTFPRRRCGCLPNTPSATFVHIDFRDLMSEARPGDVVYCDPPYVPLSDTANFTEYAPGGFSWHDHMALAEWARELARRGVTVAISNHRTPATESLYRDAQLVSVRAPRNIGVQHRQAARTAEEILAIFRPP
ncbi:DNA adenine methylase [Alicyclobacillus mali (ex Roth et al. 2021)]|uniref:DNA adenine methylase n=1 Tax=Alicyclobacillus mali (ex Roth et al. 2021) TaxID=1123961 RepID=UPI001E452F6F|nr:DNA adenine methylase [Alicyclobacillus mali (ex Roth et al. 2021)]